MPSAGTAGAADGGGGSGVWMPGIQNIKFEVRVMMVKNIRQDMNIKFSDYRLKPNAATSAAVR